MSTTVNDQEIADYLDAQRLKGTDFRDLDVASAALWSLAADSSDIHLKTLAYIVTSAVSERIPARFRKSPPSPNPLVSVYRKSIDRALERFRIDVATNHPKYPREIVLRTSIRTSKLTGGGSTSKIVVRADLPGTGTTNYRSAILKAINKQLAIDGLDPALMTTTSGSRSRFNARVIIPGDADFDKLKQYSWYNE